MLFLLFGPPTKDRRRKMVVRRRPLLLLLCLATLTVSVAGKKCRDKKTAKGCVKKRAKNFCQEESSCPKLKKGGKKCKKTRKSCRLTCGLCTPGVDPLTNQPINPNYVAPVNTALTSMMTACSCTPAATASKGPQQTGDDPNSATAPVYATVGGWDMTTGMAPPYFCVKTEYKGVDSEIAVNVCNAGVGAQNAASCPGGMQACGPTGFPRPPPSASPMKPPPPPSPPATPPPLLPPWQEARDDAGRTYYYHPTTKATSWHRPSAQATPRTGPASARPPLSAHRPQSAPRTRPHSSGMGAPSRPSLGGVGERRASAQHGRASDGHLHAQRRDGGSGCGCGSGVTSRSSTPRAGAPLMAPPPPRDPPAPPRG